PSSSAPDRTSVAASVSLRISMFPPESVPSVSIAILVRLEWALFRHAGVLGLVIGQLGDDTAEALHHITCNPFVEVLGQYGQRQATDLVVVAEIGVTTFIEMDLRQHLVGKGAVHDP